jgi:hypothetical protein
MYLKSSLNGTRKQKRTEDTNKLTLLAFKIIAILHNTLLATLIKLLGTVSKDLCGGHVAAIQERVTAVLRSIPKEVFADSFQKLYQCCQQRIVKQQEDPSTDGKMTSGMT